MQVTSDNTVLLFNTTIENLGQVHTPTGSLRDSEASSGLPDTAAVAPQYSREVRTDTSFISEAE